MNTNITLQLKGVSGIRFINQYRSNIVPRVGEYIKLDDVRYKVCEVEHIIPCLHVSELSVFITVMD